jgi:hypothetical protein
MPDREFDPAYTEVDRHMVFGICQQVTEILYLMIMLHTKMCRGSHDLEGMKIGITGDELERVVLLHLAGVLEKMRASGLLTEERDDA